MNTSFSTPSLGFMGQNRNISQARQNPALKLTGLLGQKNTPSKIKTAPPNDMLELRFGGNKITKQQLIRAAQNGGRVMRAGHGAYNVYDGVKNLKVDEDAFFAAAKGAFEEEPDLMKELCDPDVLKDLGEIGMGLLEIGSAVLQGCATQ